MLTIDKWSQIRKMETWSADTIEYRPKRCPDTEMLRMGTGKEKEGGQETESDKSDINMKKSWPSNYQRKIEKVEIK